jgi:glycine cleavage system H protein
MTVYLGCDVPPGLHYDVDGDLWVRPEGDLIRIGLTDVAQTRMGKMVSIRFKRVGRAVKAGGSVATVESAKWVGPVHTPFACEIVETNASTYEADILISNRDPYGAGWISVVRPDDVAAATAGLVTGDEAIERYRTRIEELGVQCFRCAD